MHTCFDLFQTKRLVVVTAAGDEEEVLATEAALELAVKMPYPPFVHRECQLLEVSRCFLSRVRCLRCFGTDCTVPELL